jgi:3-phosphoshikimate 1-carboxyvinyltransferase
MTRLKLAPFTKLVNTKLELPGSKSIANRVLLLAALSGGQSIISNVPVVSEDVTLMLNALHNLGVVIKELTNNGQVASYKINGCNGEFAVKQATLFCGNSGTTFRFLTAVLAVMKGNYQLTGTSRMCERPIAELVTSLQQIGAQIDYANTNNYPPLVIKPFIYNGNKCVTINGSTSSQYLSALLMSLPLLGKDFTLQIIDKLISKPYVTMTLSLLTLFNNGVPVYQHDYNNFVANGNCRLSGINYLVEPDASSASYFLATAALSGEITLLNLGANSLQGDVKFARVLVQMGAQVSILENQIMVKQAVKLSPITLNMEDMPDVAMTLAVLALFASGTTTINGIQSWKVKETDRLHAMQNELSKLGATVITSNSSISITPPPQIRHNIAIDTYDDHRMAMSFSLVAAGGIPVIINDYQCVGKTFANYFEEFNRLRPTKN